MFVEYYTSCVVRNFIGNVKKEDEHIEQKVHAENERERERERENNEGSALAKKLQTKNRKARKISLLVVNFKLTFIDMCKTGIIGSQK